MTTNDILSAIDEEISKLQQARQLLSGYSNPTGATEKRKPGRPKKIVAPVSAAKRVLNPEARARIAAAQKKRWAAAKKSAK